jgi:hypothetical protein
MGLHSLPALLAHLALWCWGIFFTTDCSLLIFLFCLQESIIGNIWDSRIPHYEDITTLR